MIIATPVLSDAATILAGDELATLPAANLLDPQPSSVWRTSGLAAAYLEIDLGATHGVNLVSLLFTNLGAGGTWRVRAAADQAALTAGPGYDSGTLSVWTPGADPTPYGYADAILWLGGQQLAYRWWRVDLADPANADGYIEAGRLYVADAWQPSMNVQPGYSIGFVDESVQRVSAAGTLHAIPRRSRRQGRFTLSFFEGAEMMERGFTLDQTRGRGGDVLFMLDPDPGPYRQHDTIYGLLSELGPVTLPSHGIYQKRYQIEEMIR